MIVNRADYLVTSKHKDELTREGKKAFDQFRGNAQKSLNAVKNALGAVALAFGGLQIGRATREAFEFADTIGKAADRIGLGTTQLQQWQFALDLAGVAQQSTNQGLLTFSKRLGKAQEETGALNEFLKRGNQNLLDRLKATDNVNDALEIYVSELDKTNSATERAALLDAAFGGQGLQMAAAFKNGADSFNQARRQAVELGLVLDEKLIRGAEKTNDMFNILSRQMGTRFKNAVLESAPALQQIAQFLSDLIPKAARAFNQAFIGIQKTLIGTQLFYAKFVGAVQSLMTSFLLSLAETADAIGLSFDLLNSVLKGMLLVQEENRQKIRGLIKELQLLEKGLNRSAEAVNKFPRGEPFKVINKNIKTSNDLLIDYEDRWKRIIQVLKLAEDPAEDFRSQLQDIENLLQEGSPEKARALEGLAKKFGINLEQQNPLEGAAKKQAETLEKFLDRIKTLSEQAQSPLKELKLQLKAIRQIVRDQGFGDLDENAILPDDAKTEKFRRVLDLWIDLSQRGGLNLDQQLTIAPKTQQDLDKLEENLNRQADLYQRIRDPLKNFRSEYRALVALQRKGSITVEEYNLALNDLNARARQFLSGQDQTLALIERLGSGTEQSIADLFDGLTDKSKSFVDTFVDLMKIVRRELIRAFIAKPISKLLFNAVGGLVSGGFGGLGSNSNVVFDAEGAQIIDTVFSEQGFARGGSFIVPGKSGIDKNLVQFMASRGEKVTVETSDQQKRSGTVVNLNIINNTNAQVTAQQRTNDQGGVDLELMINQTVAKSIRNGGPIRNQLISSFNLNPAVERG